MAAVLEVSQPEKTPSRFSGNQGSTLGRGSDLSEVSVGLQTFFVSVPTAFGVPKAELNPLDHQLLAAYENQDFIGAGTGPTVLRLPEARRATVQSRLLQQWEGTVIELSGADFVAVIRDKTNPSSPEEAATFSFDQVSSADQQLVVPGGVFYWSIAYEDTITRTRKTVSTLRFRRLPAWSRRDIGRVDREARRLKALFEDDDQSARAAGQ